MRPSTLVSLLIFSLTPGCGGSTPNMGGDAGAALPDLAPMADMASPPDLTSPPDLEIKPADVPETLKVPEMGLPVLLRADARGVQIYSCNPAMGDGGVPDGGAAYSWVFVAPEAMLYDDHMSAIGHHYAGPTWELNDSSKVVGTVVARATPDMSAIPWLLLKTASTSGAGLLTRVKYIQRVNTTAGKAPAMGCDANAAGMMARVDYTAVYYFYGTP